MGLFGSDAGHGAADGGALNAQAASNRIHLSHARFKTKEKPGTYRGVTSAAPFDPLRDLIVFTDLDGTLLDHATYSYAPAQPTLDRLRRFQIPLVLASSKTASEMVALRSALGFQNCPIICENGAGLLEAGVAPSTDDAPYREIRAALSLLPTELQHFEGFGDMDLARLIAVTGLTAQDAQNAALRQFSEPGLWSGDDVSLDRFLRVLRSKGLHARRGGRFLTISHGATKAQQMARSVAMLDKRITIALGDAPNDAEMLAAADYAIILPNDRGAPVSVPSGPRQIVEADAPGPDGWNQALGALLTQLGVPETEKTGGT